MFSRLHQWLSRLVRTSRVPQKKKKRPVAKHRLRQIERLEDRALLTASLGIFDPSALLHPPSNPPPAFVDIESFSFGANQSVGWRQQGGAGNASLSEIHPKHAKDHSSPYLRIYLEDAIVSSYHIGGISNSNEMPIEQVSINFAMIQLPSALQDAHGSAGTAKSQNNKLENDETHSVGHDRGTALVHDETTTVHHDRTETVDNNETITIHGNRTETVGINETITIQGQRTGSGGESITVGGVYLIFHFENTRVTLQPMPGNGTPVLARIEDYLKLGTVKKTATIDAHAADAANADSTGNPNTATDQFFFTVAFGGHNSVQYRESDFNFAMIHIPRIGQEVVVDFLEGDPDQPIIIGNLGNSDDLHFTFRWAPSTDAEGEPITYAVEVVPMVWLLSANAGDSQNGGPTGDPNTATSQFFFTVFLPRDYSVQYRESDFAFASRLMEEEGIYYYFSVADNHTLLVLACATGEHIPEVEFAVCCATGKHIPTAIITCNIVDFIDVDVYEIYEFPGAYLLKVIPDQSNRSPVVLAGNDAAITEGQSFHQVGSFTDPDAGPWTATVDYGDGSGEQPLVLNPDKTFSLDHTYKDDGKYTVNVHVTDKQGHMATDAVVVTAQNALPQITAATIAPVRERQLATLQSIVSDANPFDPLSVTINWGDGSAPQTLVLPAGATTFTSTHRFAHDGQFNVKVSVADDDGSMTTRLVPAAVQNVDILVVGSDAGSPGQVQAFDSNTRQLKFNITPYESNFQGGVSVAAGDVNGDGIPDIITAPGAGRAAQVKVFDGATGQLLTGNLANIGFEKTFLGGVRVAVGDVNGDGIEDIVCARASGQPEVRVFDGAHGTQVASFLAYNSSFTLGVNVAAGDVNGDGKAEIITAPGGGQGGPQVKVFDAATGSLRSSFMAYSPSFQGGVFVAAGDLNGDGRDEIITGAAKGSAPEVKAFNAATLQAIDSFFAYDPSFTGGVRVAAGDVNGDGIADIITAPASGSAQKVALFDGSTLAALDSFFALDPKTIKGVLVGASR